MVERMTSSETRAVSASSQRDKRGYPPVLLLVNSDQASGPIDRNGIGYGASMVCSALDRQVIVLGTLNRKVVVLGIRKRQVFVRRAATGHMGR